MERIENLIRFSLANGIGPVTVHRLLRYFGSADKIFGAAENELRDVDGVDARHVRAVREAAEVDPRPELEQAAAADISIVGYDDDLYPGGLREIHDPPILLYVRGELLPSDSVGVGIVGTRRVSRYGREQAERFGSLLARAGFTVVSGLARGVDSCAHRGALSAGGRTIGVLGCGLAHMYPEENRDLAAEIAGQGAVLSEFPMNTQPSRETFPRRNRIIAGIGMGVLVIEAPERSGALITARCANDCGRDVFAIPGRIDQDNAAGCNRLIRDGAVLVRNLEDILQELGPVSERLAQAALFSDKDETVKESVAMQPPRLEQALEDREARILQALAQEPIHIDHLCAAVNLPVHQVSASLMMLELKRLVEQRPGKFFVRINR